MRSEATREGLPLKEAPCWKEESVRELIWSYSFPVIHSKMDTVQQSRIGCTSLHLYLLAMDGRPFLGQWVNARDR